MRVSRCGSCRSPIGCILTLGGRIDDVVDVDRFETWRATGAYLIRETGTKLRASAGTGGKAPTLFQLFAPTFGNPALQSEESFGWDAGIDQSFLGGRANVSVTWFENKLQQPDRVRQPRDALLQRRARRDSGLEVGADAELWPAWCASRPPTPICARRISRTGLTLQRRPEHVGTRRRSRITPIANG